MIASLSGGKPNDDESDLDKESDIDVDADSHRENLMMEARC